MRWWIVRRSARIAACVSAVGVTIAAAGAQFGPAGGPDVIVDSGPAVQNEISLAVVPGLGPGAPPHLLVATYNDNPTLISQGGLGIGVSHSVDGGMTWSSAQLPLPSNSINGNTMGEAFDPSVAIDVFNNVYVAHISTETGYGSVSGVYVHRGSLQPNGTLLWLPPVEVDVDVAGFGPGDASYRFNDRCQIVADPFRLNIYVAYIKDAGWYSRNPFFPPPIPPGAPPSDIWLAVSNNLGGTWVPQRINDRPGLDLGNMPVPVVDVAGDLYVSWLDYDIWNGLRGAIVIDMSVDGGLTWNHMPTASDYVIPSPLVDLPPRNLNFGTDARARGAPVLAASTQRPGELYMVYASDPDGPGPDECDIFFIVSHDGGQTWLAPHVLSRVPSWPFDNLNDTDQVMPWIDVKPSGVIDVGWYDRRLDGPPFNPLPPGDVLWDVFMTRSADGGLTWAANVPINDTPFVTSANAIGGMWIGGYLGLVTDDRNAYIAWCSTVNDGNGDIHFDVVPNAQLFSYDWNGDQVVDFFDFALWLNVAQAGDPNADVNGDGVVGPVDVQEWVLRL